MPASTARDASASASSLLPWPFSPPPSSEKDGCEISALTTGAAAGVAVFAAALLTVCSTLAVDGKKLHAVRLTDDTPSSTAWREGMYSSTMVAAFADASFRLLSTCSRLGIFSYAFSRAAAAAAFAAAAASCAVCCAAVRISSGLTDTDSGMAKPPSGSIASRHSLTYSSTSFVTPSKAIAGFVITLSIFAPSMRVSARRSTSGPSPSASMGARLWRGVAGGTSVGTSVSALLLNISITVVTSSGGRRVLSSCSRAASRCTAASIRSVILSAASESFFSAVSRAERSISIITFNSAMTPSGGA